MPNISYSKIDVILNNIKDKETIKQIVNKASTLKHDNKHIEFIHDLSHLP